MLEENLHDAGDIIQNILTQSLSIPGSQAETSLFKSAEAFEPEEAMTSDLRKILLSFLQFQNPTEIMLRELDILQNELS